MRSQNGFACICISLQTVICLDLLFPHFAFSPLASLVLTTLACWKEVRCFSKVGNFKINSPGRYLTTGDGRQKDLTAVFT